MAVINNSGQNFTLYYNVLEYFKTIMSNHPSLGSVTQGDIFEIDSREFPIYPLGNILITNASFGKKTSTFTCQLTIADKVKLKNNESSGSTNFQVIPFNGTDDVVDIHANTLAILNDLTAYTQRSVEAIEIDDDIECIPFKDNFDNGLAGWVCTFDMLVHNNKDMCLFPLLEQPIYPPSPTTTTTTAGPTTTTTTIAPTTTTTSTTTTTTLAPITFQSSGSCAGFEGNGVIDVYNVLGGGSFPKFVGLNDGIFYPLTTPTQSFTGLGNGTFEVTVKNNEGFEASQSVVLSCTPLPTTTTTTLAPTTTTTSTTTTLAPTTTTTTTFGPISINVTASCLLQGNAELTILGITGGSGGPYFHSLQQDGVYLPSSSEYNTYTNLIPNVYTVYADNNFGSTGSQIVDLSGCQSFPTTTTTTTTLAPTTTTTSTTTTTTSTTTTTTTLAPTTTTTTSGPGIIASGAIVAIDYTGFTNTGSVWNNVSGGISVVNAPLVGQDINGFWSFNGTDEYITASKALITSSFNQSAPQNQPWTILFYGKIGSIANRAFIGNPRYNYAVPGNFFSGSDILLRPVANPNIVDVQIRTGRALQADGGQVYSLTGSYVSGAIQNMAIVWNNPTASLYQNGVLVSSFASSSWNGPSLFYNNNNINEPQWETSIFNNNGIDATRFSGSLGAFYIYNRALTPAEITSSGKYFTENL
jgi:hypothetical protein